jgi:hypothetical protein
MKKNKKYLKITKLPILEEWHHLGDDLYVWISFNPKWRYFLVDMFWYDEVGHTLKDLLSKDRAEIRDMCKNGKLDSPLGYSMSFDYNVNSISNARKAAKNVLRFINTWCWVLKIPEDGNDVWYPGHDEVAAKIELGW